jgi:hypothetical protein
MTARLAPLPMGIAIPRIVLVLLAIGTLFPLLALCGLGWSAMMMAAAFTMIYKGAAANGALLLAWSICAFYGLIVVIELLVHFWRSPWQNPQGRTLVHSVAGLAMGWVSIPLLLPALGRDPMVGAYAFFLSIMLIPVPLAISLLLATNFLRQRAADRKQAE